MARVIEQKTRPKSKKLTAPQPPKNRPSKIEQRLALLDQLESFFASLPQDAPPLRDDAVARSYFPPEESNA